MVIVMNVANYDRLRSTWARAVIVALLLVGYLMMLRPLDLLRNMIITGQFFIRFTTGRLLI
jgi:hypothetical protein